MKGIGEVLSREQMKNVLGGRASEVDGCKNECGPDLPPCAIGDCKNVACGTQEIFKMCY